jgi:hypothetical protein
MLGEFGFSPNSLSASLHEDHSQDVVLFLTGALADISPGSKARSMFQEALRVIKPEGKIVVGNFFHYWEKEEDATLKTIQSVLARDCKGLMEMQEIAQLRIDNYYEAKVYSVIKAMARTQMNTATAQITSRSARIS